MTAEERISQFHAERLRGIGGSDVAVILGLSKWKTPYQLWLEKTRRERNDADSLQMRFGTYAEQFVAEEYTRATGRHVQRFNPLLSHPDAPLVGHVDRLVIPDGHKRAAHQREIRTDRLLECKTASAYAIGGADWGEAGTDAVPEYYLTQIAAYQALTGCQHADLAVLFGNHDFRVYHIERDLDLESMILDEVSRWWRDHVIADTPPDPSTEIEARQRWASHHAGKTVEISDQGTAMLREYRAAKAREKAAADEAQAIRDQLIPTFADAEVITDSAGTKLATFKANKPSARTDWKQIAEHLALEYDVRDDRMDTVIDIYTESKPGARVLRLAKEIDQ